MCEGPAQELGGEEANASRHKNWRAFAFSRKQGLHSDHVKGLYRVLSRGFWYDSW